MFILSSCKIIGFIYFGRSCFARKSNVRKREMMITTRCATTTMCGKGHCVVYKAQWVKYFAIDHKCGILHSNFYIHIYSEAFKALWLFACGERKYSNSLYTYESRSKDAAHIVVCVDIAISHRAYAFVTKYKSDLCIFIYTETRNISMPHSI